MAKARSDSARCVVVGGGPAGMMLGLLLARAGIDVVVLEKHADFLRDFRGDTVHASTLTLLDELGLGEQFAQLPHQLEKRVEIVFDEGSLAQDFDRLPGRHQHIALVPQWDFLGLLADAGRESPHFDLVMSAEVEELIDQSGTVTGVRYLDRDTGERHDLTADLVVGCDGRHSKVRSALGMPLKSIGAPFDCLYVRLPRDASDQPNSIVRFSAIGGLVLINRGDYWQAGILIPKGAARAALADDAGQLRRTITELAPFLADAAAELDASSVATLEVKLERLRRWWAPGALCIGDAAHAMSPIAGVGINLAIQDAVATARMLAPALRGGTLTTRDLRAVQKRRTLPTMVTQALQQSAQRHFISASLSGNPEPLRMPLLMRAINRLPVFSGLFGRLVAIGLRPEALAASLIRNGAAR
ncbi:FAD-dependent oxidoreductase [Kribbella sancticallisti]|uniref:FAD-dependent oxidoreductase n=1 Tax=Kribbella sancticallisti TaxID=460087 RepID=A0ABP4PET9_9ACTN